MDFDAPPAAASGADQAGVRLYNERLILSLVRRNRQLSKVEVAKLTGLSVQTASATMNRLQLDGLLRREAPQRRGASVSRLCPFRSIPRALFRSA